MLQDRNETLLRELRSSVLLSPGQLQTYVVARLEGQRGAAPWLDRQTVAQAVKACEMLGSLVGDGPSAELRSYTDVDWARAGDAGFEICALGAQAIIDTLVAIRQSSGLRSGRAGPQAVFGSLYRWIARAPQAQDVGPIRELLREAILNSFAIGSGEEVLGEIVERRRVHSVNSLKSASGLNPKRLYRVIQKAGLIPETSDAEALNQWVFPAEEGERLIGRILNSVPQNQLKAVLGCSRTQAGQLAAAGLVNSVVPIAEGWVGVSVGAYNRDDLVDFLGRLCAGVPVVADVPEGYVDLTLATRGRSSTAEVLRWQLDGRLRKTQRIGTPHRIDGLRFSLVEVRALVRARSKTDVHRLTEVAQLLGVSLKVVKQLVSEAGGAPLLTLAPPEECQGLKGKAYVSSAEIARFGTEYLTLAQTARMIGKHPMSAKSCLDGALTPVNVPVNLGARLYRRRDVEELVQRTDERGGV